MSSEGEQHLMYNGNPYSERQRILAEQNEESKDADVNDMSSVMTIDNVPCPSIDSIDHNIQTCSSCVENGVYQSAGQEIVDSYDNDDSDEIDETGDFFLRPMNDVDARDVVNARSLRPKTLDEYIGQERVKGLTKAIVLASKRKGTPLPHMLITGPAGHGKTSLVQVIANMREVELDSVLAPSIDNRDDLLNPLINGEPMHIFFIDEIHRLRAKDQEALYSAMEDFVVTETISSGGFKHTAQRMIPPFALIAATTNPGMLAKPLLDRFRIKLRIREYTMEELHELVELKSSKLGVEIDEESIVLIAQRCRFNPREAENILRTSSDFMAVLAEDSITIEVAREAILAMGIDSKGLNEDDRKVLHTIGEIFDGGPIGVESVSLSSNVDKDTITDIVEPLLLRHGMLERTVRGRKITENGLEHMLWVSTQETELM